MSEDFRSLAGRGVARRTLLKSSAVLGRRHRRARHRQPQRVVLVRRGQLHGLGRLRLQQGVRGVHEEDRHQGQLQRAAGQRVDLRPGQAVAADRRRSISASRPSTASQGSSRTASCSPGTRRRSTSRATSPAWSRVRPARWRRSTASATSCPASGAPRPWSTTPRKRRWSTARPASATCSIRNLSACRHGAPAFGAGRHGPLSRSRRASCPIRSSRATRTWT